MQVSIDYSEGLQCCISLTFPAQEVSQRCQRSLQKLSKKANVKGFRPGKVPHAVLKQRFGASVRQDVLVEWAQEVLDDTLKKESLVPVARPHIAFDDEDAPPQEGKDVVCRITFEHRPNITLTDAADITIDRPVHKVKTEQIEQRIQSIRQANATYIAVEAGHVSEKNDRLTVDYSGAIDGKKFEGGQAEGAHILLGSGRYLPDFEAGLTGKKVGETVTFPVQFPDDYGSTDLAGKSATFTATVQNIEAQSLPELDEAFFKAHEVDPPTLGAFREKIKTTLEEEMNAQGTQEASERLWEAWSAKFDFELPAQTVKRTCEMLATTAEYENVTEAEREQAAREQLKEQFLVYAFVDKHALKVEEGTIFEYARTHYPDPQALFAFISRYSKDENFKQGVDFSLLKKKMLMQLMESAQQNTHTVQETTA